MSYKPDEKDWMAYLYGELEGADKQKFDQYLLQHPEAGRELERYNSLRALLSRAEDKEVIAPPIFVEQKPSGAKAGIAFWNSGAFRTMVAAAACIILLMLVGRFADARLTISQHEFRLSFGEEPRQDPEPEQGLTAMSPQQVQEMINLSLEKNNAVVNDNLSRTRVDLEKSLRTHLSTSSGNIDRAVREVSTASQDQLRQYVESLRTENLEQVKEYFQLASTEQKQYIENLLIDYSKYLQQQRNNDLQLFQTRINSLEQNTDMFKQETEQVLSSIITTVGTTGNNETKY